MTKHLMLCLLLLMMLAGCSSQKKSTETPDAHKYLVVYYSQTGATQAVAHELARQLEADTLCINLEQPYDGSFAETIQRCQQEMADHTLPVLCPLTLNPADYEVIFLGYPIWFGTYASPIASLLKAVDFGGCHIVPFCTFGSGGLESSVRDLKTALPNTRIDEGYGIRKARIAKAPTEVTQFLQKHHFLEGDIEELPAFSEQQPLSEADSAIFQAACGDYPMPLGTPISVGRRSISAGTEYAFAVSSQKSNGETSQAVIYVTAADAADAKPEFTRVVR